jgi:hypothetical protein
MAGLLLGRVQRAGEKSSGRTISVDKAGPAGDFSSRVTGIWLTKVKANGWTCTRCDDEAIVKIAAETVVGSWTIYRFCAPCYLLASKRTQGVIPLPKIATLKLRWHYAGHEHIFFVATTFKTSKSFVRRISEFLRKYKHE